MATAKTKAASRSRKKMIADEGARGGFTIIEVVLVLAIAGLIFLMVFIALPALQRSQRDTQRRNDLARVTEAITNYQTNNNGRLPGDGTVNAVPEGDKGVEMSKYNCGSKTNTPSSGSESGSGFKSALRETLHSDGFVLSNAVLAEEATESGGAGAGATTGGGAKRLVCDYLNSVGAVYSEWVDPDGFGYGLKIGTFTNLGQNGDFVPEYDHVVYVIKSANCNGEQVVKSSNSRDYVVMYRMEGSGVYCQD